MTIDEQAPAVEGGGEVDTFESDAATLVESATPEQLAILKSMIDEKLGASEETPEFDTEGMDEGL